MSLVQPFGNPDWLRAQAFAGRYLGNYTGTATVANTIEIGYVGDAPSVGIAIEILSSVPWVVDLIWCVSNSPLTGIFTEEYTGSTTCTIVDNVPTAASYLYVSIASYDLVSTTQFNAEVWTSQASQRGQALNGMRGDFISVNGVGVNPSTALAFPSPILSPGVHQFYFDCGGTGAQDCYIGCPVNGAGGTRLALTYGGINGRLLQGQLVVPNIQPYLYMENNVASVQAMFGTLARAS